MSLRKFLFPEMFEESPDHSSLTRIRGRLPVSVHDEVFAFVPAIAAQKKLPDGRQLGVNSTTLEPNAVMKSIVRRDSGQDRAEYLRSLAEEAGVEINDEEDPAAV